MQRTWYGKPMVSHGNRSLTFVQRCLTHDSTLINFVARHGVEFARAMSPIGSSVIHCHRRYHYSLNDCITGRINAADIIRRVRQSVPDTSCTVAQFLRELVGLRERTVMFFPDTMFLSSSDISDFILHVCTN